MPYNFDVFLVIFIKKNRDLQQKEKRESCKHTKLKRTEEFIEEQESIKESKMKN